MQMTLDLPPALATVLEGETENLPRILELGVRAWQASDRPEFGGVAEVLEALAQLPGPEEVLALRPSAELQARIEALLAKNRDGGLTTAERREWQGYEYLEHLVRSAKAVALARPAAAPPP